VQHKVFRDIYRPLENVSSLQFDRAINATRSLRQGLADKSIDLPKRGEAARPRAAVARKELDALVQQINEVLNKMKGLAEINALIKELHEIEKQEGTLEGLTARVRKIRRDELLKDPDEKDKKDKK
jgi:hypothetical protein